jgi:nitroimidazol reductase NimA-like FMN-containing flavoprotein (pyridoxamine 5'-phosphate oxidase superfamily)
MNSAEKAQYIFENNNFMVLSTADDTGKPWMSPVGFAYDNDHSLYWVSYKEALHSKNIRNRPEVAVVIFGEMPEGNLDGVYIDGTAVELDDEVEIQKGIDLFVKQNPQPSKFVTSSVKDVIDDAAWRMYKVTPVEISKRSDDVINGQAVTVREPIKF